MDEIRPKLQAAFDKVWDWFVVQRNPQSFGSRAGDFGSGCAYRTLDGRRCAVGVLIPDDEYLPDMEGRSIWALSGGFKSCTSATLADLAAVTGGEFGTGKKLLEAMQQAHDCWEGDAYGDGFHDHIRETLERVAVRFRLSLPTPA